MQLSGGCIPLITIVIAIQVFLAMTRCVLGLYIISYRNLSLGGFIAVRGEYPEAVKLND